MQKNDPDDTLHLVLYNVIGLNGEFVAGLTGLTSTRSASGGSRILE